MNRTGTTVTEQILQSIRESVTADDPLLAAHISRDAPGNLGPGFSDLFRLAAGPADGSGEGRLPAIEYTCEGYLLHHGRSRLLEPMPGELALLAGDYMYARSLNHLTGRGDLAGIRLLSRLIGFCSLVHCEGLAPGLVNAAWAVTTLKLARGDDADNGGGAPCLPTGADAGDAGAVLASMLEELVAGLPEGRANGVHDELCNIYTSFNEQRRRDGTG